MGAVVEQQTNYISGVHSDQVMQIWPRIERLFKRVILPETGDTPFSVLSDIQAQRKQLWVINDFQALAITSILDRPAGRILHAPYLVGDKMVEWLDDWIKVMEDFARAHNCEAVEFNGRRGWHKIREDYPEYKPMRTIFRRELQT